MTLKEILDRLNLRAGTVLVIWGILIVIVGLFGNGPIADRAMTDLTYGLGIVAVWIMFQR